ncbi:outer membrane usher protein PefC, partial [Photobacterium phosphoreum]|uniref:fimbria/pilus outer membrane usher protein n=1 Tax=Photobacterium phosphoreum TaxID=659 RepID=UPI000D170C46
FDFSTQNINFGIPQQGLSQRPTDKPNWDYGIGAIRLDYNANTNVNDVGTEIYGATGITANIGKWIATTSMNVSQQKVDVPMGSVTRALQGIHADLTLGKTFVSNSLVGSPSLLGVSIVSNNNMSPNKIGYTPVFSGVALTHARVTLTQNGSVIYSEMMPPGPFEIKNVNLLNSGDVTMTITETNGAVSTHLFPLTIVPNMLSPGESEYGVFAGVSGDEGTQLKGLFAAASYGYGFDNYTLKSSALLYPKYMNAGVGIVRGLGNWGTLAAQGAYSYGKYADNSIRSGGKVSLTYAKTFSQNTSLQLMGAQYTDEDYTEFSDFKPWDATTSQQQKQKSQYQLSLTQILTNDIDMGLSGWQRQYWGNSDTSLGITGNMSANFKAFSLNFGGTYSKTGSDAGYGVSMSVSIPFGDYNSYASVNLSNTGNTSMTTGISSTIGDTLDYSASVGGDYPDGSQMYSLQSNYRGDRALLNGQISQSGANITGSASISGSAIILPTKKDIIFTRNTTDTIVIANVKDTKGVKFTSSPYPTNSKGNAVIPVSSYNVNSITLDGSTLPINQELLTTNKEVVPTGGAVVYVPFSSVTVKRYLLQIKDKKGNFVPSGTWATSASGAPLGFITNNGVLFINAIEKPNALIFGGCKINGSAIKDTNELQEVTCEN